MTETRLVRACLDLLAANGIFCWRNNTGAFAGEYRGRRRFVRFGDPGSADILGVLPGGRALAVECKVGRNKLSPQQERWGRRFVAAGGVYLLQRDDVDGLMESIAAIKDEPLLKRNQVASTTTWRGNASWCGLGNWTTADRGRAGGCGRRWPHD